MRYISLIHPLCPHHSLPFCSHPPGLNEVLDWLYRSWTPDMDFSLSHFCCTDICLTFSLSQNSETVVQQNYCWSHTKFIYGVKLKFAALYWNKKAISGDTKVRWITVCEDSSSLLGAYIRRNILTICRGFTSHWEKDHWNDLIRELFLTIIIESFFFYVYIIAIPIVRSGVDVSFFLSVTNENTKDGKSWFIGKRIDSPFYF